MRNSNPIVLFQSRLRTLHRIASWSLHKGIIDGDDKDLASFLELGVVDVARDVGAGAGGA